MKRMLLNFLVLLAVTIVANHSAHAQSKFSGRYIRDEYPAGYLIISDDGNFKFKFAFDQLWDLACGQYTVKGDSVFFTYTSDMFSLSCNTERINMTDTSDYFLRTGVDKRFRPVVAIILNNRIRTVKTGDIHEHESVDFRQYYYKRKRNHRRS